MSDNRKRRSSILKVRQQTDIFYEDDQGTTTINRRVSFQNVKHVKQYDKEGGKFLHGSPLKEKITDTMDSDGILTPRGRTNDATQPLDISSSAPVFPQTFDETKNEAVDMSIDADQTKQTMVDMSIDETKIEGYQTTRCNPDETISIFQAPKFRVPRLNETTRTVRDMDISDIQEETHTDRQRAGDETISVFNMTKKGAIDMDLDQSILQNATIRDVQDMDISEVHNASVAVRKNFDETISIFNMTKKQVINMDFENCTLDKENTTIRDARDMEISELRDESIMKENVDETISLFNIPKRIAEKAPKNITIQESQEMDIEETFVENVENSVLKDNLIIDMDIEEDENVKQVVEETMPDVKTQTIPISDTVDNSGLNGSTMDLDENSETSQYSSNKSTSNPILTEQWNDSKKSVGFSEMFNDSISNQNVATSNDTYVDKSDVMTPEGTFLLEGTFVKDATMERTAILQKQIESPRRISVDRSIITTEPTTLREYRKRRSSGLNRTVLSETLNRSVANTTVGSMSRRDILDMNTSLRSPIVINLDGSSIAKSIPLPVYDLAVTNVVWLKDENNEHAKELGRFEDILEKECNELNEIAKNSQSSDLRIDQSTVDRVLKGASVKSEEGEVAWTSRKLTEIQLLEKRMDFAEECIEGYEKELKEMDDNVENGQSDEEIEALEEEVEGLKEWDEELNKDVLANHADINRKKRTRRLHEQLDKIHQEVQMRIKQKKEAEELLYRAKEKLEILEEEERKCQEALEKEVQAILRMDSL